MFRHAYIHAAILTAAALGVLCLASPALAASGTSGGASPSSGGTSLSPTNTGIPSSGATGSTGTSTTGTSTSPSVQDGNAPVSDSSDGITLTTTASATLRKEETFTGTAPASDAGQTVVIERLGHETDWTWEPTVQATISPQGTFSATWDTNHIGEFEIRAALASSVAQTADVTPAAASDAPTVLITAYLPAIATWYGPGFFGKKTACGEKLTRQTLGVANRSLKCGEKVALDYDGQTLVVPVVDRGPYANGAAWDLTEATATALGITETVTIGAVSLPTPPASVSLTS